MNSKNACISDIINSVKKDFKREKTSVIKEYLLKNPKTVIKSTINKKRGASVKIYYLQDGVKKSCDYVEKNAQVVLNALKNNGFNIKDIKELNK